MDFAWALNALRRGLKVTRKDWLDKSYLYMSRQTPDRRVIMIHSIGPDTEWQPGTELLLDATDWEEYVEPKKESMEDLDEEAIQFLEQLAKVTAEGIAAIFREDGIRRIIQKTCMNPDKDNNQ